MANGGSYSGATCAWFRQAYPNHTVGCVSSSGVVDSRWNYPEFDEHIAGAVAEPDASCPAAVRNTTAALERAMARDPAALMARFNASNLIGTTLGQDDFWYAVADGAAMCDQYGNKAELCNALDVGAAATDASRIDALVELLNTHYGPDFAADCYYDSNCLRNTSTSAPSQLGGSNSRAWRYQKCSELGYLQRAPDSGSLRSTALTIDALERQCDYVFGPGTAAAGRLRNEAHNARFGGLDPRSGDFPDTSNILYLDFSDDPWAEVSVNRTTRPSLPFCLTTCDGCGHCGTPSDACAAAEDEFVRGLLAPPPPGAKVSDRRVSYYVAPLRDSVPNATRLVDYLRQQGGTAVATNLIAYCEDKILDGALVPGNQEACRVLREGATGLGIAFEHVLDISNSHDDNSAVRALLDSPDASAAAIDALTELVRNNSLGGISWDAEPLYSTRDDAIAFAAFNARLRTALAPLGARVTTYSNDADFMIADIPDFVDDVDKVITGQTYYSADKTDLTNYSQWLDSYVRRVDMPRTGRGDAAAETWIFRREWRVVGTSRSPAASTRPRAASPSRARWRPRCRPRAATATGPANRSRWTRS